MAGPKKKSTKHIDQDQKKILGTSSKKMNLTDAFIKNLKVAFDEFNDISVEEHPNILDKIDKEDLPIYFHILEKE